MKWYYILTIILILSGILFVKCSFLNKKIIYVFENNQKTFEFQTTDSDTVLRKAIDFTTMEINTSKKEPVFFHFIFSESTPNVQKLNSIRLSLFGKNDKGEFYELPSISDLKIEYYDGKSIVTREFKNDTSLLHTLVDWKAVHYTYDFLGKEYVKATNTVTFTYTYHFMADEYPETIKLVSELEWENGKRQKELFLHKTEYKGPKLNPKY